MDIKITVDGNIILINEEINYSIMTTKPYFISYKGSILRIPFVSNIIESSNDYRQTILDNREEIKTYLLELSNLCDNLPNLILCKLPTYADFNINRDGKISFDYGYFCYYDPELNDDTGIMFYPTNNDYYLTIYYYGYGSSIYLRKLSKENNELNNYYQIGGKIIITDQEYNAELFAETIKSYVNNHLSKLLNLYVNTNTKSARN